MRRLASLSLISKIFCVLLYLCLLFHKVCYGLGEFAGEFVSVSAVGFYVVGGCDEANFEYD